MFIERQHTLIENEFSVHRGNDLTFPMHFHRSFEVYLQTKGSAETVIDGKKYTLGPGQAVLIFPYQYHSYRNLARSEHVLCFFSISVVPDFYSDTKLVPADNLFEYGRTIEDKALCNEFKVKAFVYDICGEFHKGRSYVPREKLPDDSKILPLLIYANENYREKCLLRDAVKSTGYEYTYISKVFKSVMGMCFNRYVNNLRIHESQRLLRTTDESVSAIAVACGFSSFRSFNRNFWEATGTTPLQYRKQKISM